MLTVLIKNIKPTEYVTNSKEGLGGNWGSEVHVYVSNGGQRKSNWQTTLSTWLEKQPLGPRPQRCERKHFPLISFLSQWKIQLISSWKTHKIRLIGLGQGTGSHVKCSTQVSKSPTSPSSQWLPPGKISFLKFAVHFGIQWSGGE